MFLENLYNKSASLALKSQNLNILMLVNTLKYKYF